jgi:predicted DsbA family dithiol-disulfide isomerase
VRLEEIGQEFGEDVTIEWRSFLLRPEPEPRPMEKFVKYTKSWENPAALEPRATFNQWSGENQPPSHSVPSAIAGKVAASQGNAAYHSYSERLFKAYFTENRTISDREVLNDLAGEADLDVEAFDAYWDANADELQKAVFNDYVTAIQSEITGVPAVVVNRQWVLPGALDTEQYRRVINKAQSQEQETQEQLSEEQEQQAQQ